MVATDASNGVSLAYVTADGTPLDVTDWLKQGVWLTGVPAGLLLLQFLAAQPGSTRAGFGLGAALTLSCGCASRAWSLLHDKRHRVASREWWLAHQRQVRRHMLTGGLMGLGLFGTLLSASVIGRDDYIASLLVGPVFGNLAVLAFAWDAVTKRRRRARNSV